MNEVVDEEEKLGGREIWRRKLFLKEFIQGVGAVDLGFKGRKYTWENRHLGTHLIKERLDRALASKEWLHLFSEAQVEHLMMQESDHASILLRTAIEDLNGKCPF